MVSVSPALAELGNALEASVRRQAAVSGQLRLAVSSIAEAFLAGPLLATFAARYPALQLDITVTDEAFDIVGAGFDAGVRLGRSLRRTWSRSGVGAAAPAGGVLAGLSRCARAADPPA